MNHPRPPQDPRSTKELFALAKDQQQQNEDLAWTWDAVRLLHRRANIEVFQTAEQWCHSEDAVERTVAAHVLAQLGCGEPVFVPESIELLIALLFDPEPVVVAAAATALGHRRAPAAIPHLSPLIHHPDQQVRSGVVSGLTGALDHPDALAGLIELSRDAHPAVRDWATFGLGSQTELDVPELRKALYDRLGDEDDATRNEALVGLANRNDARAVEAVIHELRGEYHGTWAVEAAGRFGNPIFHEYLTPLRALIEKHNPWFLEDYEAALAACHPPSDE